MKPEGLYYILPEFASDLTASKMVWLYNFLKIYPIFLKIVSNFYFSLSGIPIIWTLEFSTSFFHMFLSFLL